MLGPTNTGKTHRALERMCEHASGMIGVPLRLLAREVYDRLVQRVDAASVALITGEEKRVGARARYWVCTVEAMPLDLEVDFVAVDEIQLAEHPQRGHIFTDRLLHARGRLETWFLGADTMRGLIQRLLPTAQVITQPRLSRLSYVGQDKLGSIPPRSALVTFSMNEVYSLAERVMRRRGGAAVVLGALSPRARNAQVELFESGEVDYLVATDAIGMGLNLRISHVAFSGLQKFDGREQRALTPAEIAQVAGRAGRHLEPGTFGCLAPIRPFAPPLVAQLESHAFEPIGRIYWRSRELDFRDVASLLASLEAPPKRRELYQSRLGSDLEALQRLSLDQEVRKRCHSESAVRLLWETCQIPDYGRASLESHAAFVKDVFLQLAGTRGCIDETWMSDALSDLEPRGGPIDRLLGQLATIRSWQYVSNHGHWVDRANHFRQQTQALEDRISDDLHEQLTERFVMRRARGQAHVPAHPFHVLARLKDEMQAPTSQAPSSTWLDRLSALPCVPIEVDGHGRLSYEGQPLGELRAGQHFLTPELQVRLPGAQGQVRRTIEQRLRNWLRWWLDALVGHLRAAIERAESGALRGVLYQLEQGLGVVPVTAASEELALLSPRDWKELRQLGIRVGTRVVFYPRLLKAEVQDAKRTLCHVFRGQEARDLPALGNRVSVPLTRGMSEQWLYRLGLVPLGPLAVRANVAERIAASLAAPEKHSSIHLARWLGCSRTEAEAVAATLGYAFPKHAGHTKRRRGRNAGPGAATTSGRPVPV